MNAFCKSLSLSAVNEKMKSRQEKRVEIDPSLMKLENFADWADEETFETVYFQDVEYMRVGDEYALEPNNDVDGLGIYKIVHIIEQKEDSPLSGIVVKELTDAMSDYTKYTLTQDDCNYLGITYQEGLLLYPSNLPWKRVKYAMTKFDPNDMSTIQFDSRDKKVHSIFISLKGFENYGEKGRYTKTPNNVLVPTERLVSSLQVRSKLTMYISSNGYIEKGQGIEARIFHQGERFIPNRLCTIDNNEMLVWVRFTIGVDNEKLKNLKPSDLFSISWDEFGCLTVEEHEELKARQEAEAKKRAEEESERARQAILDANKRRAEIKKGIESARKQSRGFTPPRPPKDFNSLFSEFESYQANLNVITDGVDEMVNNIMKSLDMPTMPKFRLRFFNSEKQEIKI